MKNLLLILLVLFSPLAATHPHSFLDIKNKVVFENNKLDSFEMSWWLDEMTSAELLYEIGTAENRMKAMQKITEEMNQSAVENHYFSELYNAQNEPIKFKAKPFNPRLEIQGSRIIYHFTLKLAKPQDLAGQQFRFYTFEPSYYLSIAYEKPSDLTATEQSLCKVSLEEPKINQELRLYASQLDKSQSPDLPADSLSLGAQFAQKVRIVCD